MKNVETHLDILQQATAHKCGADVQHDIAKLEHGKTSNKYGILVVHNFFMKLSKKCSASRNSFEEKKTPTIYAIYYINITDDQRCRMCTILYTQCVIYDSMYVCIFVHHLAHYAFF